MSNYPDDMDWNAYDRAYNPPEAPERVWAEYTNGVDVLKAMAETMVRGCLKKNVWMEPAELDVMLEGIELHATEPGGFLTDLYWQIADIENDQPTVFDESFKKRLHSILKGELQ